MLLNISYKTEFKIDGVLNAGYQRVILSPKSSNSQKVNNWELEVTGGVKEILTNDHFNNHVNLIRITDDSNKIIIKVQGEVNTFNTHGISEMNKKDIPLWCYSQQSKLTQPGKHIKNFSKIIKLKEENIIEDLHLLSNFIKDEIKYIPGSTTYRTAAEEAIQLKKGVCQDHTQIFLSIVRINNYPCKYVSGFLLTDKDNQNLAMHAWAEVYIQDLGWVGFDVANGISPDDKYIAVAKGFDYNDVVPIKGILKGNLTEAHKIKLSIKSINE